MADAPRISKQDAEKMLDRSDVFFIDVRSAQEWRESDRKITRAVHEDRDDIDSWADKYDRDDTIILY